MDPVERAWRAGRLRFLLRPCQQEVYDITKAGLLVHHRFVWEIARRFGKSFIKLLLAAEVGLTTQEAMIHYAAPTGKMVRNLLIPNLRVLLRSCPKDLLVIDRDWKRAEGRLVFPATGSELLMAGCEEEGKADSLRGTKSNLFIIDEAGFVDVLDYVVQDIALPQTMPNPDTLPEGGKILVGSTPAISPGHDFAGLCIRAEMEGNYLHRDIYQSSAATPELIARYKQESRGEQSTTWKREYLALRVVDESRAIIPEFTPRERQIVREVERPEYLTPYVCMDAGFERDLTAIIFGYWDFRRALLVIEDELVFEPQHGRSDQIAAAVHAKEAELWEPYRKYLQERRLGGDWEVWRFLDAEGRLRADLSELHGLPFVQTAKDAREASINEARIWMAEGRVAIHPRCKELIAHLKAGIWNDRRTDFERVLGFGHFDFVAALVYLIRNVDRQLNPYPRLAPDVTHDTHWIHPVEDEDASGWRDLFKPKLG